MSKLLPVILIVIVLVVGAYFLLNRQSAAPSEDLSQPKDQSVETVPVTIKAGKMSPDSFRVPHLKDIVLKVDADADTVMKIPALNVDLEIPEGETTEVRIPGLGVGNYPIDCGPGCTGTVEVYERTDTDRTGE